MICVRVLIIFELEAFVRQEVVVKDDIKIKDMIYEIRGMQVMTDTDLALLYECKNGTKEINQAVKNSIKKFHDRYFIIDKEKVYHSGNSINHIGFRKSIIDIIHDVSVKNVLISDIKKLLH